MKKEIQKIVEKLTPYFETVTLINENSFICELENGKFLFEENLQAGKDRLLIYEFKDNYYFKPKWTVKKEQLLKEFFNLN